MSQKAQPGDRVILEIRTLEVYEGTVEYISPHNIELYDIYCQTNDVHYGGTMTFYRNEVKSISIITNNSTNGDTSSETSDSSFRGNKKIKLHPDEFNRLKEMYLQFNFIDLYNTRFKEAVDTLSNRESVAVMGLGNHFNRGKPLSLLLMADFKQVYIFDMYCLVELRELKHILESNFITKVVHDGTALFDCFFHKYRVEMKNIFDTQIVDTRMEKKKNNVDVKRNISECLTHHFNFPLVLLSAAMDDMHTKIWQERPVIKSDKIKAAQLVTYLLTLRDHLVNKILQEYRDITVQTYDEYKHLSDVQLLNRSMAALNGFKN